MTGNNEYWELRNYAKMLFLIWWLCVDRRKAEMIYDEYLNVLGKASKIAPPVEEVWAGWGNEVEGIELPLGEIDE